MVGFFYFVNLKSMHCKYTAPFFFQTYDEIVNYIFSVIPIEVRESSAVELCKCKIGNLNFECNSKLEQSLLSLSKESLASFT